MQINDEAGVEAGSWEAETIWVSTVTSKAMTSIVHSKIGESANAAQRRTGESRDDH